MNPINYKIVIILLICISFSIAPLYAGDLSANFTKSEFECRCCGGRVTDAELVYRLELIRKRINKPIIIISGFRCPEHNAEVGGACNSQHMYGKAADIVVRGVSIKDLAWEARICGFSYIQKYNTFLHVDVR